MSNSLNEYLFQLIRSMSKAEKRSFKLFAKRAGSTDDMKYLQVFEILDKQSNYNESLLLKGLPKGFKKSQLSNIKRHLYQQILSSLRLNHTHQITDIQIQEYINYARVLFSKGLYVQSLKSIEKAKTLAKKANRQILHLQIVDFEKFIEGQYINSNISEKVKVLSEESLQLSHQIEATQYLSNLSLQFYSLYIKIGYVKNEEDYLSLKKSFYEQLGAINIQELSLHGKLNFYISHVWYAYVTQDFLLCYRYAKKWVDLLKENTELQKQEPILFIKAYNNLLSALYNLGYYEKLSVYLQELQDFIDENEHWFDENLKVLSFLFLRTAQLNKHFLEGSFDEGIIVVKKVEEELYKFENKLDNNRYLTFCYKIACMYFGYGDLKSCIKNVNKILNSNSSDLREDIQSFARILNLIAHYELGNSKLVESQIKSAYRFMAGLDEMSEVQKEILQFLRNSEKIYPTEIGKAFGKLKTRLLELKKQPFEFRSFLYLDIVSWLRTKIENRNIMDIAKENFQSRLKRQHQ